MSNVLCVSALSLTLSLAIAGCPDPAPNKGAADTPGSPAKTKKKPPPWAKKAAKPAAPDESWIKDLKAVSAPEIVRRYLTLSSQGDLTKLKPLILQKCIKTRVGLAWATIGLGARMKVTEVKAELVEQNEDKEKAMVAWRIKGDVFKDAKNEELNILGKRVKTKPAPNTVKGLGRRGKLELHRVDGQWRIACPKLKPVKPGFVGVKIPPPGKGAHRPHLPGLGKHEHGDDHKGHDHKGHDHKGHDHKGHDHKGHDHDAKKPAPTKKPTK